MTEVRIYKPAKTAMQSGRQNAKRWVLEFEPGSAKLKRGGPRRNPEGLGDRRSLTSEGKAKKDVGLEQDLRKVSRRSGKDRRG